MTFMELNCTSLFECQIINKSKLGAREALRVCDTCLEKVQIRSAVAYHRIHKGIII